MSKYLFVTHDSGSYVKITETRIEKDDYPVDTSKFLEVEDIVFFKKVEQIVGDNEIKYSSDFKGQLTFGDLIITPINDLDATKVNALTKARMELLSRLDMTVLFQFFEFIMMEHNLREKGYTITDENREDMYLRIINTGDVELIGQLEKYLNAKDQLTQHYAWYQRFSDASKKIEESVDSKQVQTVLNEYLELFF